MSILLDFLRQKAPRPGSEMPAYYRKALVLINQLLVIYAALYFILLGWQIGRWEYAPGILFVLALVGMRNARRMGSRPSLIGLGVAIVAWCAWFVHFYGWSCSVQHLLLPLLVLVFFDIYEPPWLKISLFLVLLTVRMLLYAYSLGHPPVVALEQTAIILQILNSITAYTLLALLCILFSSNIQATERQLRLDNQSLSHKAETDPLTMLPNRRALLDEIDQFQARFPEEAFCVAIADIDFFKRINDTYGHSCGDYTLKTLANLFKSRANDVYSVCRWGGEEFCFFMKGKNLDEAAHIMLDMNNAVRHMPLHYEDIDFGITITIGVAENDFRSPLQVIFDEADKKLYLGKASGRDQVVA